MSSPDQVSATPKESSTRAEAASPATILDVFSSHHRFKLIWVDTQPDLPLSTEPAVMRWSLRPDDWHKFWPELLMHPCAFVFAPSHPLREGAPSQIDFLQTLPPGYDWRSSAPQDLHESIEAAFTAMEDDPTLTAPKGKALVPVGRMYTVDMSGRPRAIGSITLGPNDEATVEMSALQRPAQSPAATSSPKPDATIESLAALLMGVPHDARMRLADLMSTFARAPDSATTKAQIVGTLAQNAGIQEQAAPH
ncbi:hypothetical protein LJR290_007492 [Variovorax sp. LjRoot290]|uniref:hypothetical protein n=1 Tax=Variovorax sp. LjRoot290 TaxID=3342316 RepID=UPI003ED03582